MDLRWLGLIDYMDFEWGEANAATNRNLGGTILRRGGIRRSSIETAGFVIFKARN